MPVGPSAFKASRGGPFTKLQGWVDNWDPVANPTKVEIGSGATGIHDTSRHTMRFTPSVRRGAEPIPDAPNFTLAPQVSNKKLTSCRYWSSDKDLHSSLCIKLCRSQGEASSASTQSCTLLQAPNALVSYSCMLDPHMAHCHAINCYSRVHMPKALPTPDLASLSKQ